MGLNGEDRRLWGRVRMAMLATLLMCGALFAAGYLSLGQMATEHRESAEDVARMERLRLLADSMADEAAAVHSARGPAQAFLARETLTSTLAEFASTASRLLQSGERSGDPAVRVMLRASPTHLADALIEAHALAVTANGRSPGIERPAARRAAKKLQRLVRRRIDGALEDLIALTKRRVEARSRDVQASAKTIAVLALLLFILLWRLSLRPLLETMEKRTGALIQAKADVERALLFDGLTGLPNRRNLVERLERLDPASPLGILHIDLAGFHAINTTLGWETGERLVRYAADTLVDLVPRTDVVARVNTDSFVLAISRETDPEQLHELAVEIIEALAQPIAILGHNVALEAVIGIAARRGGREPAAKLLANADIARARAREEGGSIYFSTAMRERLAARRQTAQELLQAIVRGEIEPYFQPQIDAATGEITGVEALVRWKHPQRGLLNPHFFLDIAEKSQIGRRISDIMVRRSVEALAEWQANGLPVPRVGINFSAQILRDPELCDRLKFDLDRVGLEPAQMSVEVLETAFVQGDDDPVIITVGALAEAGFHIDLDDFGTGHASLSYLRHQTVSRLKIDRSFVRELHLRPRIRKMTAAMIQLAQTLEIEALAEGVETEAEWRLLHEMGCNGLQGFAIGKPMPAAEIPAWVAEHESRRAGGQIVAA
ncbi:MAG: bifunctional diguanylate cyclase/phosphodiesterase [Pseudomonadota bacterium]